MKLPIVLGLALAAAAAAALFSGCGDNTPLGADAPVCDVAINWSVCDDHRFAVCERVDAIPANVYVTGCRVPPDVGGVVLCVDTCPGACTKDCPPAPPAP